MIRLGDVATAGQLYRLARQLREIALTAVADPGDAPIPLGLILITDDIAHYDNTTISEITARTGLAQSLVSKTVTRLRDAGVVTTEPDPADRRRTRVSVTATARSEIFAGRGNRPIAASLRAARPDLDPDRAAAVEHHLQELIANLQP